MPAVGADAAEAEVIRSFLFVPADSERKLEKAAASPADALIVDLEDAVAADRRPQARQTATAFLAANSHENVWIRINALDTDDALADLRAVVPAGPSGIVLPKPRGARDSVQLSRLLDALEQDSGLPAGQTAILPIATERPAALFHLDEYEGATARLAGLAWGAEDLGAAVGAARMREAGNWLPPYELARSLCLFAASAAGVPAIETVYTDYRDLDGLAGYAAAARRDGFGGMLAIHPAQVDIINEAFTPTPGEIEEARRIVALFEANPGTGALGLDGRMLDRPHCLQARRVLEIAERLKTG
jgi:citrate lyase subunit beta / citryl-CoA lyase